MHRTTEPFKIAWRACYYPANVSGEPLSNHILRDCSAVSDTRVIATFDNIDHVVVDAQINLDLRIAIDEDRQHGAEQQACGVVRHIHSNAASWRVAIPIQAFNSVADRIERRGDRGLHFLTLHGQRDTAVRAVERSHPEPGFQSLEGWLNADALTPSRAPQAGSFGDRKREKIRKVCDIGTVDLRPPDCGWQGSEGQ